VRDAVPLTPAGTIRFLDELERRLQTGRDLDGAREALLSTGVRFVILRSDLDTELTGGPPAYVARSALRATPGVRLVAGFGAATTDDTGTRGQPVEIYAIDGAAAAPLTAWPASAVPAVSGAAEALPALHESGLVDGPVIFDGDGGAAAGAPRVETDTYRARHRWFGAVRGQDASRGLTASQDVGAPDYRPWGDESLRAVTAYDGIAGVAASSALSDDLTWTGLRPANRPYAALDADPSTAWLALGDPRPRLTITLPSAQTARCGHHHARQQRAAAPWGGGGRAGTSDVGGAGDRVGPGTGRTDAHPVAGLVRRHPHRRDSRHGDGNSGDDGDRTRRRLGSRRDPAGVCRLAVPSGPPTASRDGLAA
jgi:arabinofuranan 3-O-arabinosyltransferase